MTLKDSIFDALIYVRSIGPSDIIDILIVALIIYELSELVRKTSSLTVARGVLMLVGMLWLSGMLKLNVVNFLLRRTMELGLLAIVIIFQPELRRMLEKMGTSRLSALIGREVRESSMGACISQVVLACTELSRTKTGALIVLERTSRLDSSINTGTQLDATVTSELLKSIFYPKAPLHDGAAVIRQTRVAAAGCILPLSENQNLSRDLGMRHRAGLGISERTDAVVVVVSEETGAISVAVDGMLKRRLSQETFSQLLRHEMMPGDDEKP